MAGVNVTPAFFYPSPRTPHPVFAPRVPFFIQGKKSLSLIKAKNSLILAA